MNKKVVMLAFIAGLAFFLILPLKADAASVWSFRAGTEAIAKDGRTTMTYQEYKNFDLLKGDIVITEKNDKVDDYIVTWKSDNEDAVWINKSTGQARVNKFDTFTDDTANVRITAVITNKRTGKQISRAFVVAVDNSEFTKQMEEAIPTPEVTPLPTATPTPVPTQAPVVEYDDPYFHYVRADVKKLELGADWKSNLNVLMDTVDFYFGDKRLTQNDILGVADVDCTEVGTPVTKTYIRSILLKVWVKSINPMWNDENSYIINKVPINYPFDVE